jgi:hypothetical protein
MDFLLDNSIPIIGGIIFLVYVYQVLSYYFITHKNTPSGDELVHRWSNRRLYDRLR